MSYRSAFFVAVRSFCPAFSRILFYGEVIFPHDNSLEVGLPEKPNSTRISNRKFSDESSVFIPELVNNLRSDRKGWLANVESARAAWARRLPSERVNSRLPDNECVIAAHVGPVSLIYGVGLVHDRPNGEFPTVIFAIARRSPNRSSLFRNGSGFWHADFLLAYLCNVLVSHLLVNLLVVARCRVYSETIPAAGAGLGVCDLLAVHDGLSTNYDSLSLYNKRLCLDQARANASLA